MDITCRLAALLLALLLAVPGCSKDKPTAQNAEPMLPVDTSGDTSDEAGVSAAQAEMFARGLSTAMMSGDVSAVRQLIDWGGMIDRSVEGLGFDEQTRNGFRQGALQSVDQLVMVIKNQTSQGGSYRYVRTVKRGDRWHVIMRLVANEGAMNYHDLRLENRGGRVIADRLYVALTGEHFSDSLRATAAQALSSSQSMVSRLTGQAKRDFEALMKSRDMSLAVQSGDAQRALEVYDTLPESAQQSKLVSIHRIMALSTVDETQYVAAIEDYSRRFPDDATLGLISLDAAFLRKDSALLKRSYDSIQRWSGGDPLLTLMVASIRAKWGDVDEAMAMARQVDVRALGMVDAHDYSLGLALASQDHERALQELRTLRDSHGYQFSDLTQAEGYEAFAASPQYQQFLSDTVKR